MAGEDVQTTGVGKRTAVMTIMAVALAVSLTATALYIDVLIGSGRPKPYSPWTSRGHELRPFTSREELERFVLSTARTSFYTLEEFGTYGGGYGGEATPYSQTNVQVQGVDEADIVKTDGEYIYTISRGNTTLIVKAYPPDEARVVARIEVPGICLTGLFASDDRLVVMGCSLPEELSYIILREEEWLFWREAWSSLPWPDINTTVMVFDISDRASPRLLRHVVISGGYLTSRMIDDYVYVLASAWAVKYLRVDSIYKPVVVLPRVRVDGREEEIGATEIYYANITDYAYTFTTILALNVRDEAREPTHLTLLTGTSSCIYVSRDNIYIAMPTSESPAYGKAPEDITYIYRIRVFGDKLACKAFGSVPGRPLNQFSMDEHDGYLRIATTKGHSWSGSTNNIYVLDMDLLPVGALEGVAPGEEIYAARFMGDRCYLVTFRQTDPFFVIDLSDPREPRVLGYLKIPGYSDYLHPYGRDYVIGIGVETEDGSSEPLGLKVALFNVCDVSNPRLIAKFIIGSAGTSSPVLKDHKAFLFDQERGLMAFPVLLTETPYGDYVWQGAYVFNVSVVSGITLLGRITHFDEGFRSDPAYFVVRALYIGDVLYTVSDEKVKMNGIPALNELGCIDLWP